MFNKNNKNNKDDNNKDDNNKDDNDLKLFFNDILKLNPSFAFILGYKNKYNLSHIENNLSKEYLDKYKNILKKYFNTKNISLKYIIDIENKLLSYDDFNLLPLCSFNNPIIDFDYLNEYIYPKNKKYLKLRLKDFNDIIETYIEKMKIGIKKKMTISKINCKLLIKQLSNKKYNKRYKNLLLFLKNEYYKNCTDTIGLKYLKNGKEFYKLLIKSYCKYDITPEYIHKYGLKEIKKINNELKKYKNKKIYCKSKKSFVNLFKKNYLYIKKNIIPKYFNYKLKTKCNIIPVPKYLENSMSQAYYIDNKKTFYINTKNYNKYNINDILSLTIHESIPGHHYQFYYMLEKKIPLYKIYGINNVAFIEGWALYSETLGPKTYNSLMAQLFRAIRLVIDTGIHYYGWSFKKTFNFIKKYISYSKEEIKNEIYRYICIPGQAITYYIGKILILKLRKLYINKYKLGNIKDFHDFILEDGVVSFDYLFKKILLLKNKNKKIINI